LVGVLVEQAVQHAFAVQCVWTGRGRPGRGKRRSLIERSVGPVSVVVPHVLGQDVHQVTLVVDQEPVGAFSAGGAHPALCERVRDRGPRWGAQYPQAEGGEDVIEAGDELGVAVAQEELERGRAVVQVDGQVAGDLGRPRPGRVRGDAEPVPPCRSRPLRTLWAPETRCAGVEPGFRRSGRVGVIGGWGCVLDT
jgi:hypothetical protein